MNRDEARQIAREMIHAIAEEDSDDETGIRFGGDGDLGETLIDLLSAWIERRGHCPCQIREHRDDV